MGQVAEKNAVWHESLIKPIFPSVLTNTLELTARLNWKQNAVSGDVLRKIKQLQKKIWRLLLRTRKKFELATLEYLLSVPSTQDICTNAEVFCYGRISRNMVAATLQIPNLHLQLPQFSVSHAAGESHFDTKSLENLLRKIHTTQALSHYAGNKTSLWPKAWCLYCRLCWGT